MNQIQELILSDDSTALIRPILAGDWLTLLAAGESAGDLQLMLALVRINSRHVNKEQLLLLPLEDYLLLSMAIKNTLNEIVETLNPMGVSK